MFMAKAMAVPTASDGFEDLAGIAVEYVHT